MKKTVKETIETDIFFVSERIAQTLDTITKKLQGSPYSLELRAELKQNKTITSFAQYNDLKSFKIGNFCVVFDYVFTTDLRLKKFDIKYQIGEEPVKLGEFDNKQHVFSFYPSVPIETMDKIKEFFNKELGILLDAKSHIEERIKEKDNDKLKLAINEINALEV